jgi:hypothetical protein
MAAPGTPQAPASEQVNAANQQQNVAQQAYIVNQQTGPMSNLNVAPPPAKADERRQADRAKAERSENEKAGGGATDAKSADAIAKAAEEPKTLARAKTAAAAPAEAASAKGSSAESGGVAGSASPTASGAAGAGTDTAAGARAAEANAGVLSESVIVITAAPAPASARVAATSPVLRSPDGARWWRIRQPGTIEGSIDRGATWTVEYNDPAARLVRGATAAKGGCWMIGANGLVLRTRPAGGWERVTQPTTRNLVTLTATDYLIAAVSDDQGRLYRTTDGGATWR